MTSWLEPQHPRSRAARTQRRRGLCRRTGRAPTRAEPARPKMSIEAEAVECRSRRSRGDRRSRSAGDRSPPPRHRSGPTAPARTSDDGFGAGLVDVVKLRRSPRGRSRSRRPKPRPEAAAAYRSEEARSAAGRGRRVRRRDRGGTQAGRAGRPWRSRDSHRRSSVEPEPRDRGTRRDRSRRPDRAGRNRRRRHRGEGEEAAQPQAEAEGREAAAGSRRSRPPTRRGRRASRRPQAARRPKKKATTARTTSRSTWAEPSAARPPATTRARSSRSSTTADRGLRPGRAQRPVRADAEAAEGTRTRATSESAEQLERFSGDPEPAEAAEEEARDFAHEAEEPARAEEPEVTGRGFNDDFESGRGDRDATATADRDRDRGPRRP